jgi:hypothetical protein
MARGISSRSLISAPIATMVTTIGILVWLFQGRAYRQAWLYYGFVFVNLMISLGLYIGNIFFEGEDKVWRQSALIMLGPFTLVLLIVTHMIYMQQQRPLCNTTVSVAVGALGIITLLMTMQSVWNRVESDDNRVSFGF